MKVRLLLLMTLLSSSLLVFTQETTITRDSIQTLYQQYAFQKVIDALERNSEMESEDYRLLAKSYQKLGQLEQAENAFRAALNLDSGNTVLRNDLAACYVSLQNTAKAIEIYEELAQEMPDNAYYQRKLGSIYLDARDILKAIEAYQNSIELNSRDLSSATILASLYIKIQQEVKADSLIEKYLKLNPNSIGLLRNKIKISYRKKEYNEVIQLAERMFSLNDSSLLNQKLAGIAQFHMKEYEEAITLLENVLKVDEDSEILHYYLGMCYRETDQIEKATELFEKAIDLGVSENLANYYLQLGVSYEENENYPEAIKAYQIAYKNTRDKVILYHLARNYDIYYKDKSIALSYYKRYLEEEDTANQFLHNYSKYRIEELKTALHFEIDTLN